MSNFDLFSAIGGHWEAWLVTVVLIVAAVIDGMMLKVPNWLTFPMIVSGWVFALVLGGWSGLGYSLLATGVGLALLLPAYAIGGMGAGDVKLLAGVGAWMGSTVTFFAFCSTAIVGGILAVAMVVCRGVWKKHRDQFVAIFAEVVTIRDPKLLADIAAERKPTMMLLPYGIPIALGTILYFAWTGMLV